jgi:hypothetical protein
LFLPSSPDSSDRIAPFVSRGGSFPFVCAPIPLIDTEADRRSERFEISHRLFV